jgi:thiol-disulfide isomerase/thioredoxin
LFSSQIGYKQHPFQAEEFTTKVAISLESLKGEYVFLDFWAEWCAPCIAKFPPLKELYSKTDRAKFEIVGIAGFSSYDGIKRLIEQHELAWLQIFDSTNEIIETYGIRSFPSTFLIDPEGIIIGIDMDKNMSELEEKILSLMKD